VSSRIGRPTTGGPVVSVRSRGRTLAWCDGVLAGDAEMRGAALAAAAAGTVVELTAAGPAITAGLTDPVAAAAALLATAPGQVALVDAPAEVWRLVDEAIDTFLCGF